jgi:hypothetical protein
MKTLIVGALLLVPLIVEAAQVRGYVRKDGTYVAPHQRSNPDSNPYNNYNFPGNYNPNKFEITPGDPNKYLERDQQNPSNSNPFQRR